MRAPVTNPKPYTRNPVTTFMSRFKRALSGGPVGDDRGASADRDPQLERVEARSNRRPGVVLCGDRGTTRG